MGHPFTHPSSRELLKRVAQIFKAEDTYVSRDSNIVFLCGGPMNPPNMYMRSRFREYAVDALPNFRIFLAEDAQRDYVTHDEPEFYNVANFEETIGEISDCVILFPESPGSYAELGFFSNNVNLRKKLLVVNNQDLQGRDSFIALGPVNLIDQYSNFKPTLQIPYSENPNFGLVKERIENRINRKNRKKFNRTKYADLSMRDKFFVTFELVNIFQAMTLDSIEYIFRSIFGNVSISELKRILSILVAAKFVERRGEEKEFFCVTRNAKAFMEFGGEDIGYLRLEIVDLYERISPKIANVVKGLST